MKTNFELPKNATVRYFHVKRLSSKIHGIIDYGLILLLGIAPLVLGFMDKATIFSYTLGAVYLGLNLLTHFEMGLIRIISFQTHGAIDFATSLSLVIVACVLRHSGDMASFYFYLSYSVVLFMMAIASNYTVGSGKIGDDLGSN